MRITFFPRKACFIGASRIEGVHIRIKPRNDLHDIVTLFHPIGGELFEALRPLQAMAKSHPPSITEPEKRCAIGMFEVALVCCHLNWTVGIEWILAPVGSDFNFAGFPM